MKEIIYIIGIDGSGKTTLSKNLIKKMDENGLAAKYLYARYFPIISAPLKALSKIMIYKKDSEFGNFEKYSEKKSDFGKKHPILAFIYIMICLIDYIVFSLPKVYYKYLTSNIIIVDRYLLDLAVTLTIAAGLSQNQTYYIYSFLRKLFPNPTYSFYIDINTELAFSRKNDIPSISYLEERKNLYLQSNHLLNFKKIDGSKSVNEVVASLYSNLKFIESKK